MAPRLGIHLSMAAAIALAGYRHRQLTEIMLGHL
jgi:hypothetical protein